MARLYKHTPLPDTILPGATAAERLRLQEIFQHAPAPIAITNGPEHRWSFLNPAFLKVLGVKNADEVLHRPFRETWPHKPGHADIVDQVFRSGEAFEGRGIEVRLHRDGDSGSRAAYYDLVYQPLRDDNGQVEGIVIHALDVSERLEPRSLLEREEEQFRLLADSISTLAWMANPDGWIFWYNQRWFEYTGTTPEQMKGWGWQSVHDPAHLPAVLEKWKAALTAEIPFEMVFPLRGADGKFRPFLTRVVPVRGSDGKLFRWFGTNTDISKQQETEQALRRNEERLRATLAASNSGTFRWDPRTGEYLEFDDSLKQIFGIPLEEQVRVPEDFLKRVHPEDLPAVKEAVDRTRQGEDFDGEYRILMPDGSIRWIYDRAKMVFENGEPLYLVGACMDTTTRNQADIARLRLAAIVESSDDAIVSKNLNGIVTSWNKAAQRIFGYTPEEMVGRPITTIIPLELHSDETRILAKLQRGERIEHFETVRLRKNGELVDVSLTVSPVRDDNGRVIGAAKIARDITERRKAEQALRTSEKLASAGRMAATMAHEINNPLESVVNLLYLACSDAALTPQTRAYLTAADEELARVSHITKQTLGFYRESTAPLPTRISELFESLLLVYGPRIRNKKINLQIDADREIEAPAVRGELRQVLANVLQNSIEAVEAGGRIGVRIAPRHRWRDRAAGVQITVADNGSGIDPADKGKIFEPFFTTKKDFGTGLGLWVSKGIMDRHGGDIRVRSRVHPAKSWTVISIFLPLASPILNAENAVPRPAVGSPLD